MYTTVAYSESLDGAALQNIAGVADPHVSVSGDEITIPDGVPNVVGAYFGSDTMALGRLRSPRLRLIADLDIDPLDQAVEPTSRPAWQDLFESPVRLEPGEAMTAQGANDGGGAEQQRAIVFLGDGPVQPVSPGEIRSVRFTASITCVAETWVNGAITFDQELRGGDYQIVGLNVVSATLIAARLVIPGSAWRPGCIGFDSVADIGPSRFRHGRSGMWGQFNANQQPTLDLLAASTDSSQEGVMDLVRVGGVGL